MLLLTYPSAPLMLESTLDKVCRIIREHPTLATSGFRPIVVDYDHIMTRRNVIVQSSLAAEIMKELVGGFRHILPEIRPMGGGVFSDFYIIEADSAAIKIRMASYVINLRGCVADEIHPTQEVLNGMAKVFARPVFNEDSTETPLEKKPKKGKYPPSLKDLREWKRRGKRGNY